MKLLGRCLWRLLGLLPYLVGIFIVLLMWLTTFPESNVPVTLDQVVAYMLLPRTFLRTMSVVGVCTLWFLTCKAIKYLCVWLLSFGSTGK